MKSAGKVFIIGGGGHGKVVLEALTASGLEVAAFLDKDPKKQDTFLMETPILDPDIVLSDVDPATIELAIGIGHVRRGQFEALKEKGFNFVTIIHPSAIIARDVKLGEGAQLMAGAIVQPGVEIGLNTVLNTGCRIDHDCKIGAHSFIAPGATLCGGVNIGESTHIGAGSVIIENVSMGKNTIVGAGAAVTHNFEHGITASGVPARMHKTS